MNPSTECNRFPIHHFVHTYIRNSKTTDCMLMFQISNDCSITGDVYFLCQRWMQILMVRYTSKCASQSLSYQPFLRIQCIQTYNLKTSGHMWKFNIMNNFYIIGDILCVVQNCTRGTTQELRSETHIGRSLIRHCVCILQVCVYIAIWYTTMPDSKTHVPYDCIHVLHTKRRLYCQRCMVL